VTRRSSGVAPRACVRVYARVLVPPNLYIHTYSRVSSERRVNPRPDDRHRRTRTRQKKGGGGATGTRIVFFRGLLIVNNRIKLVLLLMLIAKPSLLLYNENGCLIVISSFILPILVAPCFKNLLRLEAGDPALRCQMPYWRRRNLTHLSDLK